MLAMAGRGLPQTPNRMPDPTDLPVPVGVSDVPNLPTVTEEPPAPMPVTPQGEGKTQPIPIQPQPLTPSSPGSAINQCPCNANGSDKPSLAVTHTGPPEQVWVSTSYLLWRLSPRPLDSVIVTLDGVPMFGGQGFDTDFNNFSGIRVDGGAWIDCQHIFGVQFSGFLLEQKTDSTTLASSGAAGAPVIARPITDALTNQPINVFVAQPGLAGTLNIDSSIQLGSAEMSLTRNLWFTECSSFTALAGFRYIGLEEDLTITQVSEQTGGNATLPFAGQTGFSRVAARDKFHTRNQMWAGQIGGRYEVKRGAFFGALTGKVALGPNTQTSIVEGASAASGGLNAPATFPAGVLATQSNARHDEVRWFTVAPEVGVQVGMQLTRSIRAHIGYDFLYMNNVVRPGDLVNTTVNQRFVPLSPNFGTTSGPDEPRFRTSRDDFFAHGAEFGMTFSY
jgi:hypothetical protein